MYTEVLSTVFILHATVMHQLYICVTYNLNLCILCKSVAKFVHTYFCTPINQIGMGGYKGKS